MKNLNFKSLVVGFALIGILHQQVLAAENGGLFVEPAVTYELGDTTVTYPTPLSNSTGSVAGFGIGARLGVHVHEALFLGVDGRYSMPRFKDSSVTYDADSVSTNWGAVLGLQMPTLGLRIWGVYLLGGDIDPKASGSFDVKVGSASGYRAGVGFRIGALSLNLEYQQIKYGTTDVEQFGPFSPGTSFDNVELENKSWIASVSFPLEL